MQEEQFDIQGCIFGQRHATKTRRPYIVGQELDNSSPTAGTLPDMPASSACPLRPTAKYFCQPAQNSISTGCRKILETLRH